MAGLFSLVAVGFQNQILSNDKNSFDTSKELMVLSEENSKYVYSCDSSNDSDEFFINGLVFDLEQIDLEQVDSIVSKIEFELYSYEQKLDEVDKYIKTEKLCFIGLIPLYLSKFIYMETKLIIKFPNNFLSSYNYLNNFYKYKFRLVSPIKFKSIQLNKIKKFVEGDMKDLSKERALLYNYYKYFSYKPIQFTKNITVKHDDFKFDPIDNTNLCVGIKIGMCENAKGFFLLIPDELVEFIGNDNIKYTISNKQVDLDDCNNNYLEPVYPKLAKTWNIADEKYLVKNFDELTLYYFGFGSNNSYQINAKSNNLNQMIIQTKPDDLIEIYFELDGDLDLDLDKINKLIKEIKLDLLVSNKLVGSDMYYKLKYLSGILNPELTTKELNLIEKYYKHENFDELEYMKDFVNQLPKHNLNNTIINILMKLEKDDFEHIDKDKIISCIKNFISR